MTNLLETASGFIWGPFLLIPLLVGTGLYLTLVLRGLQFRKLGHSLWLALILRKDEHAEGDISHFQALMTALAATVGTGNIAGVATAIAAGGPGALFWMWMTGLVGMATKYAEALLSVRYREVDEDGHMTGGPMLFLARGIPNRRLGRALGGAFALFAAFAAFGIGNGVQSNEVGNALQASLGIDSTMTQAVLAVAVGVVILGGIRSIARVASLLVPLMVVLYLIAALVILVVNVAAVPRALGAVFSSAFTPSAMGGGLLGASLAAAIRFGVARGIFSNESGLGSAGIAAAAAATREPVRQALVSMTQTFIDTLVICTMTGLVILTTFIGDLDRAGPLEEQQVMAAVQKLERARDDSGLDPLDSDFSTWDSAVPEIEADLYPALRWKLVKGAEWTTLAFRESLPGGFGGLVVALALALFAFSTILGWSYYGEKSVQHLAGPRVVMPYRLLFALMVFVGPQMFDDRIWLLSDVMNGLMALPNLIGLVLLSGVVVVETKRYFAS